MVFGSAFAPCHQQCSAGEPNTQDRGITLQPNALAKEPPRKVERPVAGALADQRKRQPKSVLTKSSLN